MRRMKAEAIKAARNSIEIEAKATERMLSYLDEDQFYKAVTAMKDCERIITSGCGGSGVAAKKFAHSLCCIERNGYFMPPSEGNHGGLGCIKEGDVVVFVSRGGKTDELLPMLDVAMKKNAFIIAVAENMDSPLAKNADVALEMRVGKESDPLNIMTTTSTLLAIVLFDALLAALMVETDYTLDQFGLIHPGGAVGKLLNS